MKKFYCLYNRNNLPFSWKLKQANEKPIAHFKSREDCLNYYLALENIGIIWFQKSSSKATKKENLKDSFDGYIKTTKIDNKLKHVIGIVPNISENSARILKRNLFHSLQIDSETGKDLFVEKGIDRINKNKNSYLIFDNDVAEEIMSEYDEKTQKFNPNPEKKETSSSPELLRDIIKKSVPTNMDQKFDEQDIVLKPEKENIEYNEKDIVLKPGVQNIEYNEIETNNFSGHTDTNEFINNYGSSNYTNMNSQDNFYYDDDYVEDNYNEYNENYANHYYQNDYMSDWNYFGVNLNDFNFQNDFENYKFKLQPINQQDFLNNNFQNYFNNNGKILKNNFYTWNRDGAFNMNSNKNQFNGNTNNDVWVPASQNPNMQRAYGTVEFTAVPNQTLNTEINPLGTSTMIFNPYAMQNTMSNGYSQPSMSPETIIQPVIQPVIQQVVKTVYQPQPQPQQQVTRVLEPIINEPIMANGSYPYGDYSQYSQVNTNSLSTAKTNETSEFKFNNNDSEVRVKEAKTQTKVQPQRPSPEVKKTKQSKMKKTKSKKSLYTLLAISSLVMLGVLVVIILLFSGVIII